MAAVSGGAQLTPDYLRDRCITLLLLDFPEKPEAELNFSAELGRPMPTVPNQYTFALDAYRLEGRLASFGLPRRFSVGSESFGERYLSITETDLGGNIRSLRWNAARAKAYRLQRYDSEQATWETLRDYLPGEDLQYQTERMAPYTSRRYRVLALGSEDPADLWYTVEPAETEVRVASNIIYCTAWVQQGVSYYASAEDWQPLGTLSTEESYAIVGASSDRFLIRLESGYNVWADCRYFLINLPDFLGGLCEYDIRNSYSSAFTVHEYAIPGVTDTQIGGYEQVRLAEGEYLVPVLYSAAIKMQRAGEAAAAAGYRLKIVDAFRPEAATRYLYDTVNSVMQSPIPAQTFTGRIFSSLPDPGNGMPLTYGYLMTNGSYNLNLGSFLSYSGSVHNYGLALDLTLAPAAEGGAAPAMQTVMHDLSWYSATDRNSEGAEVLAGIMNGAGFNGIDSEWWHFQDDDGRWSLYLTPRWSGVTARGWQGDSRGRRQLLCRGLRLHRRCLPDLRRRRLSGGRVNDRGRLKMHIGCIQQAHKARFILHINDGNSARSSFAAGYRRKQAGRARAGPESNSRRRRNQ